MALSPLLLALWGWRGVWASLTVAMVACTLLLAAQARRYAAVTSGAPRSLASIRQTLAQPVPWLLGTAFAAYTLQFYTVMVWLPTYLLETRGIGATLSSLLTALYILANAFGNLMGSWLVHRQVARGPTIGTAFLATAVIFLGIFSPALPDLVRFLLVLLYGFITGCIPPTVHSGGMHYARTPAELGSLQGLIAQLSNMGTFVGSPIIATAVTWSGTWDAALWVLLASGAIGLVMAWGVHRFESAGTLASRKPG